ncbi:hypothetical protein LR48_Vigan02g016100 [Vigna angularis]|uniref:Auxin-induced protein n=1 Tax=Phaseolus angularis TaxID=3914 RepID=A0A0L9TU52_PHAAN|nr:hypothetical protein LR48_Vigan02g016100 [Vigna angularis]
MKRLKGPCWTVFFTSNVNDRTVKTVYQSLAEQSEAIEDQSSWGQTSGEVTRSEAEANHPGRSGAAKSVGSVWNRHGIARQESFSASKATRKGVEVPKGYLAVYVGVNMRRFVIPISYLNQPSFQHLLCQAQEEFGYDHPTGGLTIPCNEDEFLTITSRLNELL